MHHSFIFDFLSSQYRFVRKYYLYTHTFPRLFPQRMLILLYSCIYLVFTLPKTLSYEVNCVGLRS